MKKFALILFLVSVLCLTSYAAPKNKTITYLTPETDPSSVKVDNEIISAFEKANPGVKVILSHADLEQVLPKLSAMLRAGTAPDVAFLSPRYVPGLVEQKFLVELADVYKKLGDIPRKLITPNQEGKIYDIPAATESRLVYYRKDLFEKAGISVPKTMDEWMKAAKALTVDTDGDGKIDQWGMGLELSTSTIYNVYMQLLWSFGGDAFNKDKKITIDSPVGVEALQYMCDMTKYCPPGALNVDNSDLAIMFAKGLVAMVRLPGRMMFNIDRYNPQLRDKVDVMLGPVAQGVKQPFVKATINDFVVFKTKTSRNTALAKKFVEFYMSDQQYYKFLTAAVPGHSLPVRTGWLNNKAYFENPDIARWNDVVKKSMKWAYEYGTDYQFRNDGMVIPYEGRALVDPTFWSELHKAVSGQVTSEQALKNTAKAWREKYGIQ